MTPEHPSDPPRRRASIETGPFSYTDEGSGPTLVMIHGLPGSSRDFRWLCGALEGRIRSVRLEQPGFGGTPVSTETGTRLGLRAEFVLHAAAALGLERFWVLGHSIGGPVAMEVAARAPERVVGLALLASVGLHVHRVARNVPRHPDVARLLRPRWVARAVAPLLRPGFARVGFPSSIPGGELVQTTRVFSRLSFADNRRAARGVSASTFMSWAEDDRLVEGAIGHALSAALPSGPRLVFETGGHNIQKTHAVELADALVAWAGG